MTANYAALQVFLPLLGAPLCILLSRFGRFAWILAMAVIWCVLAMSMITFTQVMGTGETISYAMGGWAAPFGIEYRIDALAATMLLLISTTAALAIPYAFRSVNHELAREQQPYFYAAFLLFFCGLMGIVSTHDAFNIYVFLEISSLASYVLIALGRQRKALAASFQYLILGTIAATLILIGIGLLYIMTGTLNISDLGERIVDAADPRPILAALAFITVGVCMKMALFPLHLWLPNAYAYAPSSVSVFLAAVSTKVGVYVLLRLFYGIFGHGMVFDSGHVGLILATLAAGGILMGSLVAMRETNLKRMLAFSSIAQIGYIMLGVALATREGLMASMVHIVNHTVIIAALFLAMGCFAYRLGGTVTTANICGMGRRHMPFTSAAFVAAGLGLVGMPLTAGFISKWYLFSAVIDKGWWVMLALLVISSLLAVIYVWRVVELLYFKPPLESLDRTVEAPASMVLPLLAVVVMVLWLGVDTRLNGGAAGIVAAQLLPDIISDGGAR